MVKIFLTSGQDLHDELQNYSCQTVKILMRNDRNLYDDCQDFHDEWSRFS